MKDRIRQCLFPTLDAEVQGCIDRDSIKNIYQMACAVMVFELLALPVFASTRVPFDRQEYVSIFSVLFCILICLAAFLGAGRMLRSGHMSHDVVTTFLSFNYFILSIWAVFVSYHHYLRGEQLLTFYAFELIMVCFVPLKPMISMILVSFVYASLYAVLYRIDGALGINAFNYVVLMLVSITVMIVRYHSQIRMAEETVQLERTNRMLDHASHHDALTELRNRKALEDDIPRFVQTAISVHIIDINDFKNFNDTYGHAIGDTVLRETAQRIRELFPDSYCYRYGGDEFLAICPRQTDVYREDTYAFAVSDGADTEILMSIGRAQGTPADHDQLFAMIDVADADLYAVKRRTHAPAPSDHPTGGDGAALASPEQT